ncbi:hypothetical protein J6590_047556 [Homalodisca vitripennis]|nr:hypothetical protein J6590_047556 [Homalodisca vitripennis]
MVGEGCNERRVEEGGEKKEFLANCNRRGKNKCNWRVSHACPDDSRDAPRLEFCAVSDLTPGIWSHVRLKRSKNRRLKVTSEPPPMDGKAGSLQGQDRSAVIHPSSSHAIRCLIRLSWNNFCIGYIAQVGNLLIYYKVFMRENHFV